VQHLICALAMVGLCNPDTRQGTSSLLSLPPQVFLCWAGNDVRRDCSSRESPPKAVSSRARPFLSRWSATLSHALFRRPVRPECGRAPRLPSLSRWLATCSSRPASSSAQASNASGSAVAALSAAPMSPTQAVSSVDRGSGCAPAPSSRAGALRPTRVDVGLWADDKMLRHDEASRIRAGKDDPRLIADATTDDTRKAQR
jgi:hypothetical protein